LTLFDHKSFGKGSGDERGVCDMKFSSKLLGELTLARCLLVLASLCAWGYSWSGAQAQNIDEGKSAQRLFADICASCHRSAGGLAKGRFRPTLFLFLQDHYTASTSAAWELSSYLAAVDTPPKSRSKKPAANSTASANRSPKRPPAAVPSQ
jgi:hypothetical protein